MSRSKKQEPRGSRRARNGKDRDLREPTRDQLDDQGRQRHIGHGDPESGEKRRPLEEGDPNEELGRPVRLGSDPLQH